MDEQPREPRDAAREPQPPDDLGDRRASADDRHGALVEVPQGRRRAPGEQRLDVARDLLARLDRGLRELRQPGGRDRDVTRREHARQALDLEVVADDDAPALAARQAPVVDLLVGVDPRRPHREVGADARAVGEDDGVGQHLRDPGTQVQADAATAQLLRRVPAQLRVERLEHLAAALDDLHLERVAVDLRVGGSQARGAELRERPGDLDARRAAADDDDPQALVLAGVRRRLLEADEERVPDLHGLGPRVHGERVLLGTGGAEEVGRDAVGDDEVVVVDPLVVEEADAARLVVDADEVLVHDPHVLLLEPQPAQEVGDVARVQAARRDLVEQGLERVVDAAVHERHAHGRLGEPLDDGEPGEPGADHHDVR